MKRYLTGLLAGGALSAALLLGGTGAGLAGQVYALHGPAARQSAATRGAGPRSMPASDASSMRGGHGHGGMMGGCGTGSMMGSNGSMMGTMGMMNFALGARVQVTSPAYGRALSQRAAATATIDRHTKTITYHTRQVALVTLGSPEGDPDFTWNVDGLVNPAVVIPTGAHVTVHFFDADRGTLHGWELTSTPPPYPCMAMLDAPEAFRGAFAMPVTGATAQRWYGRTMHFTASSAGTYYYICPVPSHAQKGMYGRLVVR